MDDRRFDEMARAFALVGTRRGAVRALAAGLIAALVPGTADAGEEDAGAADGGQARRRCRANEERCQGRCFRKCATGKRRDPRSCRCECVRKPCSGGKEFDVKTCRCRCPDDMKTCGDICVGRDRCCPNEKACGSGCIAKDACCPETHTRCPDGSCLEKGSGQCCEGEAACPDGGCRKLSECCPGEKLCPDDSSCIPEDTCCYGYALCPPDLVGCCNTFAGEECSDDGCCDTIAEGKLVCGGKCVDPKTDAKHCGGCGQACGSGETCSDGTCVCGAGIPCPDGCCPDGLNCHYPQLNICCTPSESRCVCANGTRSNGWGVCVPI